MSDISPDSIAWIEELVAGNDHVMDEFWSRYGAALQRLAEKRMAAALKRRLGPEDIVQSVCRTFVRRARGGEFQLEGDDGLWRLLCAMTLTKVRQHARFHYRQRRSLQKEVRLETERDFDSGAADRLVSQPAANAPTPSEAAEFADQMNQFLASLGEEERRLVQLRLEGLTQPEIADRLECSERTVRRLQKRVFTAWQQELERSLRS